MKIKKLLSIIRSNFLLLFFVSIPTLTHCGLEMACSFIIDHDEYALLLNAPSEYAPLEKRDTDALELVQQSQLCRPIIEILSRCLLKDRAAQDLIKLSAREVKEEPPLSSSLKQAFRLPESSESDLFFS